MVKYRKETWNKLKKIDYNLNTNLFSVQMSDQDSEINNQNRDPESINTTRIETKSDLELIDPSPSLDSYPKWINNKGEEVKQVFGFNKNAELVNARAAMIGFLMLILTELAFAGEPATLKIFGIN